MMNKKLLILLVIIIIGLFISGCSTTAEMTKVDEKLVSQFIPKESVGPDETLIYIIRESAFAGGARKVWVGCDDKIVASLGSGHVCSFKVKSIPHMINIVQAKIPVLFYYLDKKPGSTVFLNYKYIKGSMSLLEPDIGKTMVMKGKIVENEKEERPNDGYLRGIMNPGLLKEIMTETEETLKADAEHSVINFMRPQKFIAKMPFSIWNENELLGNLKGKTYFQILVKSGKHIFYAKGEHFSIVNAEVEAGKEYYIETSAKMGWNQAHLRLLPVTSEKTNAEIDGWKAKSKLVKIDESLINEDFRSQINKAFPYIKDIKTKVDNDKVETRELKVEDGR